MSPGVPTHLLNPNKLLLVCFKHAALQWNTSGGDWRTWNFFFHFGLKFRSGFGPESEAQNSRHFSHASKYFSRPMGMELEAFLGNQKKLFLDVHLQTYIGRCVLGFRRDISARARERVGMCWAMPILIIPVLQKSGFLVRTHSIKTNRIKLIKLFLTLKFDYVEGYHFSNKIDLTSFRNERLN